MKSQKFVLAGAVCAALSCPAAAEDIFKVGAITTLSGPGTVYGMAVKAALEFVADDWNAKGGIPIGGKTYKIVPVIYDDAYKGDQAVSAAQRLIFEDKTKYIMGPMGSAPVSAILPITTPNKVLTLTMGFTPEVMRKDYPYSFRGIATTAEYAFPMLKWVVAKSGVKKVVIIGPDDESGQSTARDAIAAYKRAGISARNESYERSRIDFAPILTRVISEGADGIDTIGSPPLTAAQIIKQARELGFSGKFIHSGGEATSVLAKAIGNDAIEGMYIVVGYDPKEPGIAALEERYQKKYNQTMSTFLPVMYPATQMVFAAIQQSGSIADAAKASDILQKMASFDSVAGKLEITGSEQYNGVTRQIMAPFYVGQVRKGANVLDAKCSTKACE